jgi:glycosyltransferase involved in cell wall biosynthesis
MKRKVLILLDSLISAGAENIAVNIAIKLKDSKEFEPLVCATRQGGILELFLKDKHVEYKVIERDSRYKIYRFLPIINLVKEKNVQIIHAHKIGSNFWGGLIGGFCKVPVISHFHGHFVKKNDFNRLLLLRLIGLLSHRVVSVSEHEKNTLIKEGISSSKIMTIYNGIEVCRYRTEPNFDFKRKLNINVGSSVVGIVAAFRPEKNHELFLLAAREVLKKNKDTYFLIVGDGVTRKKIENLALQLGIARNCIFTGFREDIPDVISVFDVGVLSSHWEGLPLVVLEYMASSKPVVATNVGGLTEVIEDGINGFLTPPGDYNAMAERINLLLSNKELALEMGRNGLSLVRREFTIESMIEKVKCLYDDILKNKGKNT